MRELIQRSIGADVLLGPGEAQRYATTAHTPFVAAPRTSQEAAAVMTLAAQEGWSVLCAGAGTRIRRRPDGYAPDVVLTTARMCGISEYEPADLVLSVQAGVSMAEIARATRAHKQFLAQDPLVPDESSIGGVVATAVAGPLRFAHGTPRDQVLGLELVAGDGRVLHFGGKVVKNVAGYDVVRPIVGSRGTLGLITALSLRLKPLPEVDQTLLVECASLEDATAMASRIIAARLDVVAIEIVSGWLSTHDWCVLVRLNGNRDAVADSANQLARIAGKQLREAEAATWQRLRDLEHEAAWVIRFAHLPSRLAETETRALRFAERALKDARYAVHAGDGIVRVLANDTAAGFAELLAHERQSMSAEGGTLLVERAATPVLPPLVAAELSALMSGVKRVFDPAGVLAELQAS